MSHLRHYTPEQLEAKIKRLKASLRALEMEKLTTESMDEVKRINREIIRIGGVLGDMRKEQHKQAA